MWDHGLIRHLSLVVARRGDCLRRATGVHALSHRGLWEIGVLRLFTLFSSGDKRADNGGDHILACRRTNLSWRRHDLPPAQPPCRWTTPPSRSSPPRKMLSHSFLMLPHFNLKSRLPTSPGIQMQCLEQRERWLPHDVIIRAIFAEPFHFEVAWQFPLLSCFHLILVHRDYNFRYFSIICTF